ncbi:hypothetical protein ABKA04_007990 [Annulohypoxylon sp. FPYF3050]
MIDPTANTDAVGSQIPPQSLNIPPPIRPPSPLYNPGLPPSRQNDRRTRYRVIDERTDDEESDDTVSYDDSNVSGSEESMRSLHQLIDQRRGIQSSPVSQSYQEKPVRESPLRPQKYSFVTEESDTDSNGSEIRDTSEKGEASNAKGKSLVVREKHDQSPDDDISALREELQKLREENERIRHWNKAQTFSAQPAEPAVTYKTFYLIGKTHYLDEPHWEPGDGITILIAQNPIRNFDDFLEQHPDIAFAVINIYDPRPPRDRSKIEGKDGVYRVPEPESQVLIFISNSMINAVEDFVDRVPRFREFFPRFNPRSSIEAPYLFMFHSARYLREIIPELDPISRYLLKQLERCIKKSHGFEHDAAEALARQGRVSNNLFGYLIRPGDVLVRRAGPQTQAYLALDWATESAQSREARRSDFRYDMWKKRDEVPTKGWDTEKQKEIQGYYEWSVPVWFWSFDGNFLKHRTELVLGVEASYSNEIISIDQLKTIPLQYASPDIRNQLEKRGRMFWSLRYRRFVSYRQSSDGDLNNVRTYSFKMKQVGLTIAKVADRYMVDVEVYKKLHPKSELSRLRQRSSFSLSEMKSDDPPKGNALLLFPPQIPGFKLLRKMWVDLYVDYMSAIEWNKQAFADLVAEDEIKELVQALVMKQLAAEQSTDFVAGKGNGLIVLLHGGPGTGKTFTAEGVAEFAEKPLLRVTCGDIGTQAEAVERKLQSSFYLGKIWDCVVLLDEADVFLEERDMKDLNRNALVSVFLRELEYHDGILILTSNRVGTFDEAFKSRIQLSLHYDNLGLKQRQQIWLNFINRVKSLDSTIDYHDIMDHIGDLSKENMNGREIRNAITTARQLAQFKEKPLDYSHLKHVLRVNRKFGQYLSDLRDGLTEDEIKHEKQLRLSYQTSRGFNRESLFERSREGSSTWLG